MDLDNLILETSAENVDIIPSNVDLAGGAEIELIEIENRELILKKIH